MSREDHCARCGYLSEYHDVARRCPGMKTGKWTERDPIDGALWPEILARDVAARTRAVLIDPEKWRDGPAEARGKLFARATRVVLGMEPMPETGPIPVLEPIVCARPPRGPHEFAGYHGKQAVGLGRLAAGLGFDVAPYYWMSGERVEGCAVKGYRAVPGLAFVATWKREPSKSWATDVAYAWNPGGREGPARVTVTELEEIIRGG